jgi:hypothetical protein
MRNAPSKPATRRFVLLSLVCIFLILLPALIVLTAHHGATSPEPVLSTACSVNFSGGIQVTFAATSELNPVHVTSVTIEAVPTPGLDSGAQDITLTRPVNVEVPGILSVGWENGVTATVQPPPRTWNQSNLASACTVESWRG